MASKRSIIIGLAISFASPVYADGYDALRADPEIENGVLIVAIGDIIQDACPNFEDRRFRSVPFLMGLRNRANELGYSDDEIRGYIDDDAEKARVTGRALLWFEQQGASPEEPESICQVARAEIAAESAIGRLIQEN